MSRPSCQFFTVGTLLVPLYVDESAGQVLLHDIAFLGRPDPFFDRTPLALAAYSAGLSLGDLYE